jgi:AAA ATPase domain
MASPPSRLLSDPRFNTFVGRDSELRTLEGALHEAVSGSGRLVLIAGEPGIGKTRLCEEFATRARGSGTAVLYGRCYESGGSPAFLPWVRLLGAAARSMEAAELRVALGETASCVAQLVPAIRKRLPDVAPLHDLDATEGRLGLFDGVVGFLGRLARPHGLVNAVGDPRRTVPRSSCSGVWPRRRRATHPRPDPSRTAGPAPEGPHACAGRRASRPDRPASHGRPPGSG